jgi:muramoyltetrapeptide carboxypeptidase LdcA involved in peptidoglycan recycling
MTIKPAKLLPGDTFGIVSPSWGGGARYPHRIERGAAHLRSLDFRVKIAPHALNSIGYVSDTAENRAADIHALFMDPEVKAIVASIGGDHSCHLLPLLDFDLIASHPKVFVGYSDITVLNVAIHAMTGLVTFNGPALMTDFAEYPTMLQYTEQHFLKTVCNAAPVGQVVPSDWWTEEVLDWATQADLTRPRVHTPSSGCSWLKPGRAEGVLIGGCIESLQHLRGTRYWPDWTGAILFFETSEEKPSPATIDGILMDYENMGVFDRLAGLLVGRPMAYTAEERQALREVVLARTRRFDFPIIADMDFGHTAPQMTLPIGCRALIDGDAQRFEIVEAAVI